MGLGIVVATLAAMAIGALIVRRRGVYFAMVTIAFGQVFYFLAFRWNSVTGGDDGLTGWHRLPINFGFATLDIFGNDKAFYYFALAVFAVCVAAMAKLIDSPFGRSLTAIRENERRARFLGVPIEFHIWLSFVISCLFVSVAGALYALLNNFTDPRALRFDLSGNFVIMAVLGGMRFVLGAADRRGDLRRAAGLRVEPDRKLDVGHRSRVRAGGSLLSARSSWECCAAEPRRDPASGRRRLEALRQPGRRSTMCRLRSSRANCAPSSGRTAPARRRSSTSSAASSRRPRAR